ncbi:hypothetical protein SAMN05216553_13114 [Lentzea fradiae]|uniref:Uncharacterized protein n=1 Tax=Lentzea fradiae TaxID=200378 RepID=A0A1G8DLT6_9PSEU|nr:hypothetical protein [Lentzea fradiae]SDH58598.1 hypothetical protein SAMN05216553_13114 [Lentzea fradiae]
MLGELELSEAVLGEFADDVPVQLMLVALLDDPWRLWSVPTLAEALGQPHVTVYRRMDRLRHCGVVQRVPFWPERERPWRYWVSPDGLRSARWLIRANFEVLHETATPLGFSVRKALGFGSLLDACRCACGRCCCGLPHI